MCRTSLIGRLSRLRAAAASLMLVAATATFLPWVHLLDHASHRIGTCCHDHAGPVTTEPALAAMETGGACALCVSLESGGSNGVVAWMAPLGETDPVFTSILFGRPLDVPGLFLRFACRSRAPPTRVG